MWVRFSQRMPKENIPIITRFPGRLKGDSFETWNNWTKDNLKTTFHDGSGNITHWWDGTYDFDLAVKEWYNEDIQ
jgi:hypothetical protein